MIKNIYLMFILIISIVIFSSCEKNIWNENNVITEKNTSTNQLEEKDYPIEQKANRLFWISLTDWYVWFDKSFKILKSVWVEVIELSQQWDDLEKEKWHFSNEFLDIANIYYSEQKIKLSLTINPIDTNSLRVPKDLRNTKFDDKEMIDRFKKFLDYIFSRTDKLEIVSIWIWNEIDIYLANDKEKWEQYSIFYNEISKYIHNKKPWLKVWTKVTYQSLNDTHNEEIKNINKSSDIIMITYYPIKDYIVQEAQIVHETFNNISEIYPEKKIQIMEIGYPTSNYLKSSEEKQADFIEEVFKARDSHKEQITLLNYTWLHDIRKEEVAIYKKYYWISSEWFLEYLASLGIKKSDWTDKIWFSVIKNEAKIRWW